MPEGPEIVQESHGSYIAQAASGGMATIHVYTALPSLDNQNRRRFVSRLRTRYHDLLAQSLYGVVRLNQKLEGHAEAVAPPVRLLYQSDQQPMHQLPLGTTLSQVYTEAGHELLILGGPGSGKSTLLLELAADLVEQAEQDERQPLPVIIPLSSWSNRRPPLEQWLSEQVALFYDLHQRLAERWVREERLLPLLDGLDEIQEEARADCITAINVYHRAHLHPLVIASRQAEYETATRATRLVLNRAVIIQPLTDSQIDASLAQLGESGTTLRKVIQKSPALQELVTPLLLSILLLSMQASNARDLSSLTDGREQQQQILTYYMKSMLARKQVLNHLSPQQMIRTLQWLARQMRSHAQTIFYLEHLQPDWLPTAFQHSYRWWTVRVPAVLMGVMLNFTCMYLLFSPPIALQTKIQWVALGALSGWFLSQPVKRDGAKHTRWSSGSHISSGIPISLIVGLLFLISFGPITFTRPNSGWAACLIMMVGSLILSLLRLAPLWKPRSNQLTQRWSFLEGVTRTLQLRRNMPMLVVIVIGIGLDRWLSNGLPVDWLKLYDAGYNALKFGLNAGISAIFLNLLLEARMRSVILAERLHWTWRSFQQGLFERKHLRDVALVSGSILFLAIIRGGLRIIRNPVLADFSSILGHTLILVISYGFLYWILLGLFQGISSEQIKDAERYSPNQGIRRSLSNSLFLALISGLLIGIFGMLSLALSHQPNFELNNLLGEIQTLGIEYGLSFAITGSLFICSWHGGLAVLGHLRIRQQLARAHLFPWNGERLLEEATTRILLRRIGGGYSFPHRLLLDYFADLELEDSGVEKLAH